MRRRAPGCIPSRMPPVARCISLPVSNRNTKRKLYARFDSYVNRPWNTECQFWQLRSCSVSGNLALILEQFLKLAQLSRSTALFASMYSISTCKHKVFQGHFYAIALLVLRRNS